MTRALPTRSLCIVLTAAAALLACAAMPAAAKHRPAAPAPATAVAADSLAVRKGDVTAFRTWARGATLDELMYVLRRSQFEIAAPNLAAALEAALVRVPADRAALRATLAARLAVATAKPKRGAPRTEESPMPSAFRVALLLPDSGVRLDEAAALEAGFRAGLASRAVAGRPPIEVSRVPTGSDGPGSAALAFQSAAWRAALLCGGLERDAAMVMAASSFAHDTPLLLPAIDDAAIAGISGRAFTVGPRPDVRARELVRAAGIGAGDRVATLVSTAIDSAFAAAFAYECRSRGATVVLRLAYAPGNLAFAPESRTLLREHANVLFWDGDANEAAALLRQLTRDRVSLRLCGGEGLDPSRHHRETRVLLEGVRWVQADWALADSSRAAWQGALAGSGADPTQPLAIRGWIAGRAAGAALSAGAYTPDEVSAAMVRAAVGPYGTLDAQRFGAVLPVSIVREGRSEPAPR